MKLSEEERSWLIATLLEAKWMQKASASMERRGTKGTFSARAKSEGKTSAELASAILSGNHSLSKSGTWRKRANFARNAIKSSKN